MNSTIAFSFTYLYTIILLMNGHNMSCLDLQHQNYWFQQKGVPNARKQKPCNFFSSLEKKPIVALQKCGSRPLLLGFQVANENFSKHPPHNLPPTFSSIKL